MEKSKAMRRPLRASLTRTVSEVDTELKQKDPNKIALRSKLDKLEELMPRVLTLDNEILEAMVDAKCTDEEVDKESQTAEEYEDKVRDTKRSISDILFPASTQRGGSPTISEFIGASSGTSAVGKKTYKLPKIELKKFSGELTEWLGWWSQFKKIDEDEELHASDKFQYLVQCMTAGSPARALIERYPQSSENYPKVVETLKERFGNEKLLKQVYIRELLKMIMAKGQEAQSKSNLSTLYDKLDSHLRSLESLGVTIEQAGEFLFPMVESSLPQETLVAWQRSPFFEKDGSKEDPIQTELDYLMKFLKKEIDNEQQRNLAQAGFEIESAKKKEFQRDTSKKKLQEKLPTAAGLFNSDTKLLCFFCEKKHDTDKCITAQSMLLEDKKTKLYKRKVCFLCFKSNHNTKTCKAFVKCVICGQRHHHLMCPGKSETKPPLLNTFAPEFVPTTHTGVSCSSEFILQTLVLRIRNERNGKEQRIRVLIDTGSQRSYILKTTAQKLGIKSKGKINLKHELFGGNRVDVQGHNILEVEFRSVVGNFSTRMKLLDQQTICGLLPRVTMGSWMSKLNDNKIKINDTNQDDPLQIEVLLGVDNLGSVFTGKLVSLTNGLTAMETNFGWTLMGELKRDDINLAMSVITMNVISASVSELWKLETIGINDPAESKSRAERELETKIHFKNTVNRTVEGRYTVKLPWIDGKMDIPTNKAVAEKRLEATTKKLQSNGNFSNYEEIFLSWQIEGIITDCSENNTDKCGRHYIPHRAVLKPGSKTTPVRPVFDASCKTGRFPSLNDCLEKGPNLLERIPSILIRFRIGKIGLISDIRKAFLMIEIDEDDREFLRFLWWQDVQRKSIKVFQHNRVVFGMNCSPFLLGAVIEYHLENIRDNRISIAQNLIKSLYVDNCVSSVDSFEEYNHYKNTATELMAEAKMELRQWECTLDNSSETVTSVLGLRWDKNEDQLYCALLDEEGPEKITKRVILSLVQRFFDPLGFLCPALLIPKLLLQKSWSAKNTWDEEVDPSMSAEFLKWFAEMTQASGKIKIPRNCTGGIKLRENFQLHTFSDASKVAYAAIVLLRVETEQGVSVQLLQAKSRVAPITPVTIPRLELLSCTIASRLTSSVKEALNLTKVPTFFWSDSTTALAWIKRNDEWGTFVGNRVREICSLTNTDDWRHVPGTLNPADLPSRGCNPLKLLESKWWEGPEWLKRQPTDWPTDDGTVNEELVVQEIKKSVVSSLTNKSTEETPWWLTKHQKYIDNVRVVAMVLRYIGKLKKVDSETDRNPTQGEITRAEYTLFKLLQEFCFPKNTSVISGLEVVVDEEGLMRVKTRLVNRQDTQNFRYPILLPTQHPLIDKMIREIHQNNCHAGIQTMMGLLREDFWIIHSRRTVKKIIKSCIPCKKLSIKKCTVPPAPLPENRVKNAKSFDVTGIDLAGPLFLKTHKKCWIVLYTCAIYRGVHLELVDSLSTEDFLWSWDRFVSRKSRPNIVYTDNGTNFVGAANLFKTIDWEAVKKRTKHERVEWKFNPPSAPWWGGWWERLIRCVKEMLKRMLGNNRLLRIELETILCKVESIINRRPFTFVTNDADDLIPLTPSMFMNDLCTSESPEEELLTIDGLQREYKNMEKLYDELRSRFRKEYLSQMIQRGNEKKHHEFKVGDLVWIGDDNKKRFQWPMAKILKLFQGKDGHSRVAQVKTSAGIFTRPLQRLYPMEISSSDELGSVIQGHKDKNQLVDDADPMSAKREVRTRFGRLIKPPARLSK